MIEVTHKRPDVLTAEFGVPVDGVQEIHAVECPSCVALGRRITTQVRRYGYYPDKNLHYFKCLQCVHPIKQALLTFAVRFIKASERQVGG